MEYTQPKVLIVILNYITYAMTINLIKELLTDLDYENYSIMVVDNCSPNESAEILEQKSKEMGYIFFANNVNVGYAAGNNIGIRYGIDNGFSYSWILNNDVLLRDNNVLFRMVEIAEEDNHVAVVGPKIFSSNDTPVAPFCNRPTLWSYSIGIKKERDYRETQIDVKREVYCVYGCCMLLKNKAMKEIDCMDERTFLYGEENILAERLLQKGYKAYYVPDVSIKHNESFTTRLTHNKLKMRLRETIKSYNLYLKEYRHFKAPARWFCYFIRALIIYIRN